MSRQSDLDQEGREQARREFLIQSLEYGLVAALRNQGADLRGFAIKYDDFSCLITLKADFNDVRHVCFIYSDTMMNCIISATRSAAQGSLSWKPDKYHQ